MTRLFTTLYCLVLLIPPALAHAAEADQATFDAAYALSLRELDSYRKNEFLVGLTETSVTVEAVTLAYELGKQAVSDPVVLAELTANYGGVLRNPAAAEVELEHAIALIDTAQKQHGDSEALIKPLISIGHLNYRFGGLPGAVKYYRRAFKLADKYWDGQQRLADLYLEAGVHLSFQSHGTGKDYMKEALDIYSALGASEQMALANMHLGRFWIRRGKYVQAERYLQAGLAVVGDKPANTATFVGLHTQLVKLYSLSFKPELARQHSQIIGSTYAGKANDELTILYVSDPRYPQNARALSEDGVVTLSFTVNEFGEVVNPVVIESTGHHEFEVSALNAIQFARYAPRFVDGRAVATDNVRFTYSFSIVK